MEPRFLTKKSDQGRTTRPWAGMPVWIDLPRCWCGCFEKFINTCILAQSVRARCLCRVKCALPFAMQLLQASVSGSLLDARPLSPGA